MKETRTARYAPLRAQIQREIQFHQAADKERTQLVNYWQQLNRINENYFKSVKEELDADLEVFNLRLVQAKDKLSLAQELKPELQALKSKLATIKDQQVTDDKWLQEIIDDEALSPESKAVLSYSWDPNPSYQELKKTLDKTAKNLNQKINQQLPSLKAKLSAYSSKKNPTANEIQTSHLKLTHKYYNTDKQLQVLNDNFRKQKPWRRWLPWVIAAIVLVCLALALILVFV